MIGNWHQAEDILVETFTKLAHSNLQPTGNLKAWIYRVATNDCYKIFRKAKHENSFSEESFQEKMKDFSHDILAEIRIQKILNRLSEKHRIVILLKFYEDMTYQEIADILCCPLGTVKSRIHEGLEKLRRLIGVKNEV